jgi:lipopolysaccharide/colanic/teichoic acid biosynthesis glycosyltransferase
MLVKHWNKLPKDMQNEAVRPYYETLRKKWFQLFLKRCFDIVSSFLLLVLLLPIFLIIGIIIKADSDGPVFYRQERVTQYGKLFRIFKFRTMVTNADKIGSLVTVNNDSRVTKVGKFLRKTRLDETPQLLNILNGDMTFVGTRPEVLKYVDQYTDEMKATLLLPAGVTSQASIEYKDEETLLAKAGDIDNTYLNEILPEKMKSNYSGIQNYKFSDDIRVMGLTLFSVL